MSTPDTFRDALARAYDGPDGPFAHSTADAVLASDEMQTLRLVARGSFTVHQLRLLHPSVRAWVLDDPSPDSPPQPQQPDVFIGLLHVHPHDHKGYSEEKCIRCGWVMGSGPLNCMNDDTPHVFPSQLRSPDSPGDKPCQCGAAERGYHTPSCRGGEQ